MKTAAIMIERVSIVCPECRCVAWIAARRDGDEPFTASRQCPQCGTRYRVPALAFRVGKDPR